MKHFKLNSRGFGHVELFVGIIFIALFAFVGYRVVSASHADTVAYLSQSGCEIRGRKWVGGSGNPCGSTCASGDGTLVGAPVYNYCSNTETPKSAIPEALCTELGRVWLDDGCARSAVANTNNPNHTPILPGTTGVAQCVNKTYAYFPSSPLDICQAPPKATTTATTTTKPVTTTATTTTKTTTPAAHTNTAVKAGDNCKLRGRKTSGTGSTCTTGCISGAGSLVTSGTYAYCSGAVSKISQATCTTNNRVWLTDGCARLWTQKTTAKALQCNHSGYTYYVASSIDYCKSPTASKTSSSKSSSSSTSTSKSTTNKSTVIAMKTGSSYSVVDRTATNIHECEALDGTFFYGVCALDVYFCPANYQFEPGPTASTHPIIYFQYKIGWTHHTKTWTIQNVPQQDIVTIHLTPTSSTTLTCARPFITSLRFAAPTETFRRSE